MKKLVNTSRIAITTACLLCCIPQDALCASLSVERVALELASPDAFSSYDPFLNFAASVIPVSRSSQESPFLNLANLISESDDPVSTTKRFLELFQNHKGAHLSTAETCQLLRQNAHLIPREHHESLYLAINVLENSSLSTSDSALQNLDSMACRVCWPWDWNWFGLNKKEKKHSKESLKIGWPEVLMFALLVAGVVLVAIYSPAALIGAGKILIDGAKLFL